MADLEFFDSKIEKGLIDRLRRVAEHLRPLHLHGCCGIVARSR